MNYKIFTRIAASVFLFLAVKCNAVALSSIEQVSFLAGLPKPPFIMNKKGEGLQIDIIRDALFTQNMIPQFQYIPLSRSILNYQQSNVDAVSIVPSNYKHPKMFVSEPYITYQDVAVSLVERELKINSLDDLSGLSVVAYQRARKFLGEDYNYKVAQSSEYREIADQLKQIDMLFTGQAEVIILDINIFNYFSTRHNELVYQNSFNVHYIFGTQNYSAGFKSKELKEIFDKGISTIKKNGVYEKILAKYL